ncbi:MAG TPA: hypothetical protein VNA65_07230, partial [Candidatus Dormibacteraeota bacterium]|nr:hypothetical protein [Candidatus Dormibacteraeota bacterium]
MPAIHELADLAESADWVAEHPEVHLLPGLRSRIQISGLNVDHVQSEPDGGLSVRLVSPKRLTRREIRQSVWTILGGAVELSTLVRETQSDG